MSLDTLIDLDAADRRGRVEAVVTVALTGLAIAAAIEHRLAPGAVALLAAGVAVAAAVALRDGLARRGAGRRPGRRLLRIDGDGRLWLQRDGEVVPARLAGAQRLGPWCRLDLRLPADDERKQPSGVARHAASRFRAQWLLPGRRPRRVILLLARRRLAGQWPALMRWLVWTRRTGRPIDHFARTP